jgi:hypothetical protein
MTCLNEYAKKFVTMDFSPYEHLGNKILQDNSKKNFVPLVEVPGLDKIILTQLHNKAVENDSRFERRHSISVYESWSQPAHSYKWTQFVIHNSDNWNVGGYDGSVVNTSHDHNDQSKTILPLVNLLFTELKLIVSNARFAKLEPGGFITPHVDTFDKDSGISYFWMPLHEHLPTVKTFPWGWNEHVFGSVYLFNYSKYLHAAINFDNTTRYILHGRFDQTQCGDRLLELYQQNKDNFQKSFNQHPLSLASYLS